MTPEVNPSDESEMIEEDEFLEEQSAPRKGITCWMALILIIIAACLLMRVLCFNLSVFNFDPLPL